MSRKALIFYNILILFILYFSIAMFFAVSYIFLDFIDAGSILDHYATIEHQEQWLDIFTRSVYFSCVTLFAVGYGDMSPIGLAKGVAIIQSLVGYILPYAIILNYLVIKPKLIKFSHKGKN